MNTTKVHIYINNVYRHRGSTVLVGHVQEKDMNGVVQVVLFASYAVQAAGVGRYTSHKQQWLSDIILIDPSYYKTLFEIESW